MTITTTRPPGPGGGQYAENLPEYALDPLAFLGTLDVSYGDVVSLTESNVLLRHPRDIRAVLVDRGSAFVKVSADGARRRSHAGFPTAMMNSVGSDWSSKRKRLGSAFDHTSQGDAPAVLADESDAMLDRWAQQGTGARVDLHREFSRMTMQVACRLQLGVRLSDDQALTDAVEAIMRLTASQIRLPAWLPTPNNLRLRRSLGALDLVLTSVIDNARKWPPPSSTALGALVRHPDDLSDAYIKDELATLLMSGHETLSGALTWTLVALAGRHDVTDKISGSDGDESVDLLEATIKESLRLYPPAWITSRVATTTVKFGGYDLPAGTVVAVSQWVTHRDERWFDDALAFRPERWLEGASSPSGAYFPFGLGERACIGGALARTEMRVILQKVLRRTRVEVDVERVTPRAALALQPVGALARVTERSW